MDDIGLLERARRGEEEAFSQLFARYQRAIFRYAAYMCGPDAGDDIVQETFLAVLQQKSRGDAPTAGVQAYLLGIARHRVLKRLSSSHDLRLAVPVDDETEAGGGSGGIGEAAPADRLSVLDYLTRAEMLDAVRAAVQSLPPVYREVVVLCELQEMDYAGAAAIVGCPIGTVRSRLHRAKGLLTIKLAAIQPVARTRGR